MTTRTTTTLTCMCNHVSLQCRRVDERLSTDGAHVRTFTRMSSHVFFQQVRPGVLLAAHLTGERAFTCISNIIIIIIISIIITIQQNYIRQWYGMVY